MSVTVARFAWHVLSERSRLGEDFMAHLVSVHDAVIGYHKQSLQVATARRQELGELMQKIAQEGHEGVANRLQDLASTTAQRMSSQPRRSISKPRQFFKSMRRRTSRSHG